jgi:hypothetical protein
MNWGHKITIVIIIFLVAMLGMVFYASMQTNEMIDDNYYTKELEYQQIIDAKQNLMNVSTNNLVGQNLNEIFIILPAGAFEKLEGGYIELLRTDSEKKDVRQDIKSVGTNRFVIPKSGLTKGIYKARISWKNNGIPYYKEESVFVEKG